MVASDYFIYVLLIYDYTWKRGLLYTIVMCTDSSIIDMCPWVLLIAMCNTSLGGHISLTLHISMNIVYLWIYLYHCSCPIVSLHHPNTWSKKCKWTPGPWMVKLTQQTPESRHVLAEWHTYRQWIIRPVHIAD